MRFRENADDSLAAWGSNWEVMLSVVTTDTSSFPVTALSGTLAALFVEGFSWVAGIFSASPAPPVKSVSLLDCLSADTTARCLVVRARDRAADFGPRFLLLRPAAAPAGGLQVLMLSS